MRASIWFSLGLVPCLLVACQKRDAAAPPPEASPNPASARAPSVPERPPTAPSAADSDARAPSPESPAAPPAPEPATPPRSEPPAAPPTPAAPASRAAQLANLVRTAASGADEIRDVAAFLKEHVPAVFDDGLERTFPARARIRAMTLENEGAVVGVLLRLAPPEYFACDNTAVPSIFGLLLARDPETGEEFLVAGPDQQTRVFDGVDVKLEFPADFATARSFGVAYRYDGNKDCPNLSAPSGLYMDLFTVSLDSLEVLDTVELDRERDDRGRLIVDRAKVDWLAGSSGPLLAVRQFRSETLSEEAGGAPGGSLSCRLMIVVYVLHAEGQWEGMEGDDLAGLRSDEPTLRHLPESAEGDAPQECDALRRKLDG
ncbi:MAG: hypothetical protein HY907_09975 [Deltaproteobacteria bacterium]|nr:hypothetical protein [Deltaproteobacteria bacterium]